MKGKTERRRSHRYAIEQMVQVSGMKDEFLHAKSINISEHGLSCTCAEEVELASRLFLILTLDNNETIKVESMVVWTKKKGNRTELGIEFTDINPQDEKILHKFLAKR